MNITSRACRIPYIGSKHAEHMDSQKDRTQNLNVSQFQIQISVNDHTRAQFGEDSFLFRIYCKCIYEVVSQSPNKPRRDS